jgi:hypothetical protein
MRSERESFPYEVKSCLRESVRQYFFLNDHIMRGPLCRAMGLIDLMQRDDKDDCREELLKKLLHEIKQIDVATKVIAMTIEKLSGSTEQNFE